MKLNKQYLLNNLWFGENQRRRVSPQLAIAGALVEPDYFRVWGTDHSGKWDGNVDFRPMVERGAKFTFIKCIDGTVASPLYYENRDRARGLGLLTGPYGWLYRHANVNCKSQAQAYWERIKNEVIQLPPTIDFEWTKYLGVWSNPNYEDLRIYAEELVARSGRKSILYTAPGFISPLGSIPKVILDLLEGVWIAQYGVLAPDYNGWLFHQFSAAGNAAVLSPNDANKKEVDLNYCKDLQTLYRLAGEPSPQPDPEPIGDTMQGTVKAGFTITVRRADGTDTGKRLKGGDKVYGDEANNRIYYQRIYRADGTIEQQPGNSAIRDATTEFMTLVPGTEPQPIPDPSPSLLPLDINITDNAVTVSGPKVQTVSVELRPR